MATASAADVFDFTAIEAANTYIGGGAEGGQGGGSRVGERGWRKKVNEPRRKEVWDAIHSAFHQASLSSSLAGMRWGWVGSGGAALAEIDPCAKLRAELLRESSPSPRYIKR